MDEARRSCDCKISRTLSVAGENHVLPKEEQGRGSENGEGSSSKDPRVREGMVQKQETTEGSRDLPLTATSSRLTSDRGKIPSSSALNTRLIPSESKDIIKWYAERNATMHADIDTMILRGWWKT